MGYRLSRKLSAMRAVAGSWRGFAGGVLGVFAVALLDRATAGACAPLYGLLVVVTALGRGWMAGATLAGLSAALVAATSPAPFWPRNAVEAMVLLSLPPVAGWLVERDRRQMRRYRQLAEKLSAVYEKVQANLDGMKRAERLSALGQLSAGLAHEIRNPLASISGAAAILKRNPELDAKQARCIDIITNECQRLNGLLTNFLNFARPRPPRFQTIHVETVLDGVVSLAGHGVHDKTVHLEKRIANGLPAVECDPEQLEQVLLNLMINAIEASPDGETVCLAAEQANQRIVVRVSDSGPGVEPAHVDRLFDPFFTTKEHGTGLGLPVAHQIMRQMGGALIGQKNAVRGMTFSVVLPAKTSNQ